MSLRSRIAAAVRPHLATGSPLYNAIKQVDDGLARAHHGAARFAPALIRPAPEVLYISVTGSCNYRCIGCRYERDFMVGERLTVAEVEQVLLDAHESGVRSVRLYGGEPLLHPDLPGMIQFGSELGLDMYVTTNGSLLEKRIDELVAAGLRWLTIGYYGHEETFSEYTQRPALSGRVERALEAVRRKYDAHQLEIQLNFVLVRPLATRELFDRAWRLVQELDLVMHFDIYGYSVPFFTSGPEDSLAFRPEDAGPLRELARHALELKREFPNRFPHSEPFLRSMPDWATEYAEMRLPCDAYRLLWIGPDGSVQLCDTAFPLGNIRESRLRDIAFSQRHKDAARGAFQLSCPNCNCQLEDRIRKHGPSWRHYSREESL